MLIIFTQADPLKLGAYGVKKPKGDKSKQIPQNIIKSPNITSNLVLIPEIEPIKPGRRGYPKRFDGEVDEWGAILKHREEVIPFSHFLDQPKNGKPAKNGRLQEKETV